MAEATARARHPRAAAAGPRLLLWAAMLAATLTGPAGSWGQESFTLDLGGRRAEIPLRRIAGVRYVTLSDLARGLGGGAEWLEVGERAAVTFLGERVVFRRDVPFVEARGELHQIPQAPRFQQGELYVPFSFIQQGLPSIFPERFDFEAQTSSFRAAPPGRDADRIEYLVAPGLTTLRLFFSRSPPLRLAADNSLPHTLVVRVEGPHVASLPRAAATDLGLVDSIQVQQDPQGAGRLVFHLAEEAFLYQVARLEDPAGLEVTVYSPAAGVDVHELLARGAPPEARGLPPPPIRRDGAPREAGSPTGPASAPDPALAEAPASGGGSDAVSGDTERRARGAAPVAIAPATPSGTPRAPRAGIRTLVVDAGHGGRDVGAVGPGGLREKDVTLHVALALARELEKRSDLHVILTRERDVFVPLAARTRMANEAGADLFISIHCNAARSRSGAGFETYFLSEAKTEDERRVARMENASLRFENPEIDPDQLGDLNFILWDLAQNEYLRESSVLAELVQRGLADELDRPDRGVKQAGFWVLNGAFMPAVLVETAFISNPLEERLLGSSSFQDRLVDGIADSVMEYVDLYERKVTLREVGA